MSSQSTAHPIHAEIRLNHLIVFLEDYQSDKTLNLPPSAYEEVRQLIAFYLNEARFEEELYSLRKELKSRDVQIRDLNSCISLLRDELAEALSSPGAGGQTVDDFDGEERSSAKRPKAGPHHDASLKAKVHQIELAQDLSQNEQQVIGRNVLSKLSKKIKSNEQHLKEELEKIRREALEDLEGLRDKLKEVEHEKDHLEVKLKEREDSAKDQIESLTLMLDEKYARVTQYGPYRSHGEADIEAHGLQPRAGGRERGEEL